MTNKIWKLALLLSFVLTLCACGSSAENVPASTPDSNQASVSTATGGTESRVEAEDDYALSDAEISDIYDSVNNYLWLAYEKDSIQFSYRHVEDDIYELTGVYTVDNPELIGFVMPAEFTITVSTSDYNGKREFSSLMGFESYFDYGHSPLAIKEIYDIESHSSSFAIYDRDTQTEKSDYYANIFDADENDTMIVMSFEGLYGVINCDGSIIVPAVFDEIYDYGFIPEKDAAIVRSGSAWGIINHAGQYLVNPSYYKLVPCGDYVSATTYQKTYGSPIVKSSLIDWNGNVLIAEDWGEQFVYYDSGYYVCADDDYKGKLYDSDLKPHDFSSVYAALGMHYNTDPAFAPSVRCSAFGWNKLYTGGQYIYLLNDDMELISTYSFVKLSYVTNENRIIGRETGKSEVGTDIMLDHDGNVIMIMPQERVGLGLNYSYNGAITDYYAFGDYLGGSITDPFFCILDTQELVVCEKVDRIPDSECLLVKLKDSSLYCVYDKGVKVKEAFYKDYTYDYETKTITLKSSDTQSETYVPQE